MAEWLKSHHPFEWSTKSLNESWVLEVLDGDVLIAYGWLHFAATHHCIEFHACTLPGQEGRWLTPHVLDRLFQVGLATGAEYCIAQVTSPRVASIWRRVGARVLEHIMILPLKET